LRGIHPLEQTCSGSALSRYARQAYTVVMIVLFTDFGWNGPYVGQMKAVLLTQAPDQPIVDLMHDAPHFNPRAAAYLLASMVTAFPPGTVFLAVVDPGVGTEQRRPCVVQADGRWFVGPDNGLFNRVARQAVDCQAWHINWQPKRLSDSFHGRDYFAPIAAQLANDERPAMAETELVIAESAWPDELAEVIYLDDFGNAMTGLQGRVANTKAALRIGISRINYARTFAEVPTGQPFWYVNSNGLIEIAINQGSAARQFGLTIGTRINL
jgi:S-adenosyl-L-methionine hydrolase (adenosine-forming)